MKKTMALLLSFLLLTLSFSACQPTPEHDVIVNKAEQTIPPTPTRAPLTSSDPGEPSPTGSALPVYDPGLPDGDARASREGIPEHVSLSDDTFGNLTLIIDADVNIDSDGVFPVIEVGIRDLAHDLTFIEKLFSLLCPGCSVYEEWERTKDDVRIQMQATIDYDGHTNGVLEIDEKEAAIADLTKELKTAPDEPQRVPCDYSGGFEDRMYYLEMPDGAVRMLNVDDPNTVVYNNSVHQLYFNEEYLIPGDDPVAEPIISEEEAVSKADGFLKAMGFSEVCLLRTEQEFGFDIWSFERSETLWTITYTRAIGSSHSTDPNAKFGTNFTAIDNLSSSTGSPWRDIEMIVIKIGSEGIYSVIFSGACEETRTLSEDVPFLEFDSAYEHIIDMFHYLFSGREQTVSISDITLIYGLSCIKDVYDYGVYIPMWQVQYTMSGVSGYFYKFFSAIDGSTQEPRFSRQQLMELGGH